MKPKRETVLAGGIFLASLILCLAIGFHERHDPTDDSRWYLGLFILALAAGWLRPGRPWRWGAIVVIPQWLTPFYPEVSNLWPFSLIIISVLILPAALAAGIGGRLRLALAPKSEDPPPIDGPGEDFQ